MKQTSVEWLANEFYEKLKVRGDGAIFNDLVNQAKKIEKQQQDELSIGFMNWCIKNYHIEGIFIGLLDDKNLLETYKKEQGL